MGAAGHHTPVSVLEQILGADSRQGVGVGVFPSVWVFDTYHSGREERVNVDMYALQLPTSATASASPSSARAGASDDANKLL